MSDQQGKVSFTVEGDYYVADDMVHINYGEHVKSAQLGGMPPKVLANILMKELIIACARKSHATLIVENETADVSRAGRFLNQSEKGIDSAK